MQQQQFEDKQLLVARICAFTEEFGKWGSDRFELSISPNGPEIKVRDITTGFLVAYSSTKADYAASLEEFAWDFFASPGES